MTHPILALQSSLVTALREADLAVFDAPPAGQAPPYAVIARHDALPRDGDTAPGHEHRLLLHLWAADPSRKAVVTLAESAVTVVLAAELDSDDLRVTLRRHDRTDTSIDATSGRARAAIALTFFSEPNS
jgi:hypothetical protein